jgi:diacylglycerol kinase
MRTAHTPPGVEPVEEKPAGAAHPRAAGFGESLRFAAHGIAYAYRSQRNLRIQAALGCSALALACVLALPAAEIALVALASALVLAAELGNTAVETAVDLSTREFHPLARLAKDVAAGAVLLSSVGAVVVGALLFVPRLLALDLRPGGTPWALGVLAAGTALHLLLCKIPLAFDPTRD